jgi:tetratricopeptide (TPR) repeat protein
VAYQNAYNEDKSGNFQVAIKYLKKASKSSTNKADIYNLMGYSHRKLDLLEDAFFYYEKALKLDPRHLGANEYIGELYLRTNNLKKAEEHLEVLDDICLFGCDEYDDLKDAIAKYKKSM